jgi:hypothetical protein
MVRFEMRISFPRKNEHWGPPSLTPALLRKQGPRCRSKTVQTLAAPQKMRQEIPTDPQFGSMQQYNLSFFQPAQATGFAQNWGQHILYCDSQPAAAN